MEQFDKLFDSVGDVQSAFLSDDYLADRALALTVKLARDLEKPILFEGEADLMVVARKGSPLAIGHGDGEMFVGSDAIALAPMTDRITYLEEGDRAIITRSGAQVFDAEGNQTHRAVKVIRMDQAQVDKAGHKHFMAKEIAEQPVVLGDALKHHLSGDAILPDLDIDFSTIDRLVMVACGTASLACFTAKYWFEQIARIPVEVDVASEFRYREPPIPARTAALLMA